MKGSARPKIAVFVSGKGSNFSALLAKQKWGLLKGAITLCVADRPEAGGLATAQKAGIECLVLKDPSDGESLLSSLRERSVSLIVLAGYVRLIPPQVVAAFKGKILNIHPARLPAFGGKGFYGLRVHKAVLDSGVPYSGATVHFVTEEYDKGPAILQSKVPVRKNDTPGSLQKRVLRTEHRIYWRAVNRVLSGRA
jgi:formyltetrahydrofolate-dependent phosphoribosylglycinamide formyltransferase